MIQQRPFKQVSLHELEQAFSEALTKLLGAPATVQLHEIRHEFSTAAVVTGRDAASFTGHIEASKYYGESSELGGEIPD